MSDILAVDTLPRYAELPVVEGAPAGSSWGLWGDGDKLGALNLLTPARVARAKESIRQNRVLSLTLPLDLPAPPLFARRPYEHVVTDTTVGHDEYVSDWFPQSSSQWDGFRHVRHPEHGYYGGVSDMEHGVEHWAEHGIVGRGVLADVGRFLADNGRPLDYRSADSITADDVADTLEAQGSEVETGDILVIRTGWTEWYRGLSPETRSELAGGGVWSFFSPGLRPGVDMAEYLWDLHISALASDNPAVERWPRGWPLAQEEALALFADPVRCEEVSLHFTMLPLLGIPLGELWDLDELALESAADGLYDFFLSATPLPLPGGVGSPANAVAIR
jgi:kynurenine formamidase